MAVVVSVLYRKVEVQVEARRQEPAGEHKDTIVHHCHHHCGHATATTITATITIPCILQPGPSVLPSVGLRHHKEEERLLRVPSSWWTSPS